MTEDRDKWRKCVHGVANPRIEDGRRTEQTLSKKQKQQQVSRLITSQVYVYTLRVKKQDTKLLPITSSNINHFHTFFTDGLSSKYATNSSLNIPPRFKNVAILPCEIRMSGKWHQSEICILINDRSQGSTAKHLRCDKLLYYTFII